MIADKMPDETAKPPAEDYVRLLWSGGFDSTARLLDLIRQGRRVRPFAFYNGIGKQVAEMETRYRILAMLKRRERTLVVPVHVSDYGALMASHVQLHQAIEGWREAIGIFGPQMSAIKLMRMTTDADMECCIVKWDAVWWGFQRNLPGLAQFFMGLQLPYLDRSKRDLWNDAPKRHRKILRATWCCEGEPWDAVESLQTCEGRGLPAEKWCTPCSRRLQIEEG